MRIVVDAMGGDLSPDAAALGALDAAEKLGVQVVLVGRGEQILACLKRHGIETLPQGVEIAKKTFNPRLGIEGGISVLGTSGIVEPMSEQALTQTIFLEMKMLRDEGHRYCYLTPGNYGNDFLRQTLGYDQELAVKCSNYIGDAIDDGVRLKMDGLLLVGHIGKLVKIAAGVMNTHSRQADCRMEVLASHGAMAGLGQEQVKKIMNCIRSV